MRRLQPHYEPLTYWVPIASLCPFRCVRACQDIYRLPAIKSLSNSSIMTLDGSSPTLRISPATSDDPIPVVTKAREEVSRPRTGLISPESRRDRCIPAQG